MRVTLVETAWVGTVGDADDFPTGSDQSAHCAVDIGGVSTYDV